MKLLMTCLVIFSQSVFAHDVAMDSNSHTPVLADMSLLRLAKVPVLYADPTTGLGYTILTGSMQQKISQISHSLGHCGGFEALSRPLQLSEVQSGFAEINRVNESHQLYPKMFFQPVMVRENPRIKASLQDLSSENLKSWVQWLTNFPTRWERAPDPNIHVVALAERLKKMRVHAPYPVHIDLISHVSTKQKSLRVTIPGSTRPSEIIVLGGHLDSINHMGGTRAPGADDNASGSANLLEALRVLIQQPQPQRTIEFYFYAAEEAGLVGSGEIASKAKADKRNIIAVLQLDMTLQPGNGNFTISSISDYTSPWLREYLLAINQTYLNLKILDDKCGYACSDHASWYRQGYPTLLPFESSFNAMNRAIHTEKDIINDKSNFEHALSFGKIAYIMAMDLGNSTAKQPYR